MTYLWYDLETFGRYPRFDRIAQFAALRTNEDLEPIEEPVMYYARLSPDYLPDPLACLVTGITPQEVNVNGLCEADFLKAVDGHLSRPGTCALGYNTIEFDDEFIRNLYYRNFADPYRREWDNGNSRWDILNLVRATRDLRPEGIEWPCNAEGKPSVKLELLTQANNLEHGHAHDALSDVYATLAVARLIRETHPKLFQWALTHRSKEQARTLIDLSGRTPLVHTSSVHYSERGNTTLVCPIVTDPFRRNIIYAFDLRQDPEALLNLPEKQLRYRIFTPEVELNAEGLERIALTAIAINKVPFLAPGRVLTPEAAERLGIDVPSAMERWKRIKNSHQLVGRLRSVFLQAPDWGNIDDPDLQIYDRFFPDEDKTTLELIRNTRPHDLPYLKIASKDPRIPEMLRRYIGRNWPEVLDEKGKQRWKSFCASRILFPPIPGASDLGEYRKRLMAWKSSSDLAADKKPVIKALEEYGNHLEKELLTETL